MPNKRTIYLGMLSSHKRLNLMQNNLTMSNECQLCTIFKSKLLK